MLTVTVAGFAVTFPKAGPEAQQRRQYPIDITESESLQDTWRRESRYPGCRESDQEAGSCLPKTISKRLARALARITQVHRFHITQVQETPGAQNQGRGAWFPEERASSTSRLGYAPGRGYDFSCNS